MAEFRKFRGRIYERIDPVEVEDGDIVEYVSATLTREGFINREKPAERRCHRVAGVRMGKRDGSRPPQFWPEPHRHEPERKRWYSLGNIMRAWRRRTR